MPEARWRYLCCIADCVAAVEGGDPLLREVAEELFRGARVGEGTATVTLSLERSDDGFVLATGGAERCRTADLSVLFQEAEAILTASVMAALDRYYQVHAGVVARSGRAWLLAGPPESGKTSLTVALGLLGAAILTDEVALVEPASLRVAAFRRDLMVRSGTWGLFPELAALARFPPFKTTLDSRYVSPHLLGSQDLAGRPALELLVFPRRVAQGRATVRPVGQAEAARRLLEQSFNLEQLGAVGIELVARLVEQCPAREVVFADARQAGARLLASQAVQLL